jgi:hypothetical protein
MHRRSPLTSVLLAVFSLAAVAASGCGGAGSFVSPVTVAPAHAQASTAPVPAETDNATVGYRYRMLDMPKRGPGGLMWADFAITDNPEATPKAPISKVGRTVSPFAAHSARPPKSYEVRAPIVDGKPELPRPVSDSLSTSASRHPLDHALSGCGTPPDLITNPGMPVSEGWYFPEILIGANGQPYQGNITWAQGATFNVPITGSVAYNPAQTPNDATTTTLENFTVSSSAKPNLYQFSATGILGDGTQEGTTVESLLVYYPIIDPVNVTSAYVLVPPGGAASYEFTDQTDARDGAAQWQVWSSIPPNSSSAFLHATTSGPPHANTLTIQTSASTPPGEYAVGVLIQYGSPLCRQSELNAANVLVDVETPSPSPSPKATPTGGASSAPSTAPSAGTSPVPSPTSSGCGGGGTFVAPMGTGGRRTYGTCIPVVPYIKVSAIVSKSGAGNASVPGAVQTPPSQFMFNLGPYSPQISFEGPVHLKLDQTTPVPPPTPWTLKLQEQYRSGESSQTTRQTSVPLLNQMGPYSVNFACLNMPSGTYSKAEGFWVANGSKVTENSLLANLPVPAPPLIVPSKQLLQAIKSKAQNPSGALLSKLPNVLAAIDARGIRDLNWIAAILSQIEAETTWTGEVEVPNPTPSDIAALNAKYAWPGNDHCNHMASDGSLYRGRGLVQLTGRCIYYYYTHDKTTNPGGVDLITNPSALTATANAQLDANIAVDLVTTGRNGDCVEAAPNDDTASVTCSPKAGSNLSDLLNTLQPDGGQDEIIPSATKIAGTRKIVLGGVDGSTGQLDGYFNNYRGVDDGC